MTARKVVGTYAPAPRINVLPDLITSCERRNSSHCLVAEAISKHYEELGNPVTYVSVDLQTVRFTDPSTRLRYTYLTPRSVQMALIKFDQGHHTEPFSFLLKSGQVTEAGKGHTRKNGDTPKQQEALRNLRGTPGNSQRLTRSSSGEVPTILGGKTPPLGPLPGSSKGGAGIPVSKRRQFGLRGFDRIK